MNKSFPQNILRKIVKRRFIDTVTISKWHKIVSSIIGFCCWNKILLQVRYCNFKPNYSRTCRWHQINFRPNVTQEICSTNKRKCQVSGNLLMKHIFTFMTASFNDSHLNVELRFVCNERPIPSMMIRSVLLSSMVFRSSLKIDLMLSLRCNLRMFELTHQCWES